MAAATYLGIEHPFAPVLDARCHALVLGTFPSVRSRESAFYYGHPQNRFWPLMTLLFGGEPPVTPEQKRAFLLANHVALWDVLASCDIRGSADGSIRSPVPNDVSLLLACAPVTEIFTNGRAAAALYHRWCEPVTGRPATALPSTSAANARWTLKQLAQAWSSLKKCALNDGR
jgi:hypoxanthine-DNA glycosylase